MDVYHPSESGCFVSFSFMDETFLSGCYRCIHVMNISPSKKKKKRELEGECCLGEERGRADPKNLTKGTWFHRHPAQLHASSDAGAAEIR